MLRTVLIHGADTRDHCADMRVGTAGVQPRQGPAAAAVRAVQARAAGPGQAGVRPGPGRGQSSSSAPESHAARQSIGPTSGASFARQRLGHVAAGRRQSSLARQAGAGPQKRQAACWLQASSSRLAPQLSLLCLP